ncbi:hypothetical protein Q765_05175 [Flavobacterium rivuli WB 3.3-2 = DSM 21788]|uniref:Outer membrane protein beta-barrel domain-containing protein n=1 Tax=Flavobacterium rivuli WB 3.3-2 = DSM 21788 TaxID=1121895 RepID=A0A0A2M7T6_9FLAO|nr:porin family protein [Flavobacterium rivuli]KGO87533.1 hypothetical protein Q765_05175 [Flavobacterium rivuli WB 3.3-2 = DSM 21788]
MKKIIFSIATLFAIALTAHSQEIKYGVKAGLNIADFGGDSENTNVRAGFNAGVLAEIKFGNFAVQPEIVYSQQGTKIDYNIYSGSVLSEHFEYTSKLSYINVPIALKYYIIEGLSIQAGPQIGFLVSAKLKGKTTEGGREVSAEVDAKDLYEKIDFAVFGGIGYDLPIGVFFQARYNAGLSDIGKDSEGSGKITNNVFSFSVGYKF